MKLISQSSPHPFSGSRIPAAAVVVVVERRERGGGVAAQLMQAEEMAELLVEEGVPLGHVGAPVANPGDHGQADVRLDEGHSVIQYTGCSRVSCSKARE